MWVFGLVIAAFGGGIWLGGSHRRWRERQAQRSAASQRLLYEMAEGDLRHVATELEAICEAQPHEPAVFLALAAIDRERGRVNRAKALHRVVLASADLDPELRVAGLVGLGRDLLAEGNVAAAVGALNRANSLAPSSPATLASLATALDRAGAWEPSATAWERLERHVSGRKARAARVGRGRALAGQAMDAKRAHEDDKARKLAARALELAPDSGFAWLASARIEGKPTEALLAWQRAWELAGAGASTILDEAATWAELHGRTAQLVERIRASLRGTSDPTLVVPLARGLVEHDARAAVAAWRRVAEGSDDARWELLRAALSQRAGESAELADVDVAWLAPASPTFRCAACQIPSERFAFRCPHCGRWESLVDARVPVQRGLGRLDDTPTTD